MLPAHTLDQPLLPASGRPAAPAAAPAKSVSEVAKRKLLIGTSLCLAFMLTEIVGGILAHSLAVMTDAAHMLSDVAGCARPRANPARPPARLLRPPCVSLAGFC